MERCDWGSGDASSSRNGLSASDSHAGPDPLKLAALLLAETKADVESLLA